MMVVGRTSNNDFPAGAKRDCPKSWAVAVGTRLDSKNMRGKEELQQKLPPHWNPSLIRLLPWTDSIWRKKTQPLVWPQVLRLGSTKNNSWLKSLQPGRFPRTLWSRTFMYVCSCLVDLHKQDETFASHCIYASHVPSAIWMPNPISLPLTSRFLLWQGLSSFALCHSSNHHLYNVYALKMLALTIPSRN